jgi:hypothetical protein
MVEKLSERIFPHCVLRPTGGRVTFSATPARP